MPFALYLAVLVVCMGVFVECADVAGLYNAAARAHQSGQLLEALELYDAVLKVNPKLAVVHNNVGSIHHTHGNVKEALRSYKRAAAVQPDYAGAHLNIALVHNEQQEYTKALRFALAALKVDPKFSKAHQLAGNLYQNLNEQRLAARHFLMADSLSEGSRLNVTGHISLFEARSVGHTQTISDGKREWQMETLSTHPRVFLVRDYLTHEECDRLVEAATAVMEPAHTVGTDYGQDWRTGQAGWLRSASNPLVSSLFERSKNWLNLSQEVALHMSTGQIQMVHYQPGHFFRQHHDSNRFLRRFATLLYYLNDVARGGQTQFPLVNSTRSSQSSEGTCVGGLVVPPVKGSALLFYNYDGEGNLDEAALHAACDVLDGDKWAANQWVTVPESLVVSS